MKQIVIAIVVLEIALVACMTAAGCAALNAQEAKTIARPVIDLAAAVCVARAQNEAQALLCHDSREIVRMLFAVRRDVEARASGQLVDGGVK